jgi:hypothetical protein
MRTATPGKSPKHTKDYYADYITAEDRQGDEPNRPDTPAAY